MGIRCIAVYVDSDSDAPFVADADEAVHLSGGYLDSAGIIEAAMTTGADAIHPGYGFLAENAGFATAVEAAGLIWVGPSPTVITTMGDKLEAKSAAAAAGVPILPSSDNPSDAAGVGFPLLVKAAAGGGGKGMHLVEEADQLDDAVASAEREAAGAFGDARVFLERWLPRSRHVEIQILGDSHGNLVHLGERECSIQRRHQKIIEESPSPAVDDELRAAMGAAALSLAAGIGYSSAGTVEFLLDNDTGDFFFLEVNTRLQVEHPVTEEVTGIDLVREQIRIAAGEPLGVFDGVPVAVKDELDQVPYPTTVGTAFLGRESADEDATVAARFRAQGALLFGKTAMHEIGIGVTGLNPHHGTPRNPYDPGHFTGGSSSGPAAVVAAVMPAGEVP